MWFSASVSFFPVCVRVTCVFSLGLNANIRLSFGMKDVKRDRDWRNRESIKWHSAHWSSRNEKRGEREAENAF
jgi:hypothetical protein